MTPEQVLSQPPRVLSQKQRDSYFAKGYLLVENAVPKEWVERLRLVTAEMVERSRERTKSDAVFDLEPGHTAEKPRLRRLSSPVEHHPAYWDFVVKSPIADIAADLDSATGGFAKILPITRVLDKNGNRPLSEAAVKKVVEKVLRDQPQI